MASPNEFNQPVSYLNGGPFETTWGPHTTKEAACAAIKNELDAEGRNMRSGKTVAIGTVTDYVEHAWQGGFLDGNLKPSIPQLTDKSLNFFNVNLPGNLPNTDLKIDGGIISNPTGNYNVTALMSAAPGRSYTWSNVRRVEFRDINNVFVAIILLPANSQATVEAPERSAFQMGMVVKTSWDSLVVVEGTTLPSDPDKIQEKLKESLIPSRFIPVNSITQESTSPASSKGVFEYINSNPLKALKEKDLLKSIPNLFSATLIGNVITGDFNTNGTVSGSSSGNYNLTGPMSAIPGTKYTYSNARRIVFFSNSAATSPITPIADDTPNGQKTVTAPEGSVTHRAMVIKGSWDSLVVVEGTTLPSTEGVGKVLEEKIPETIARSAAVTPLALAVSSISSQFGYSLLKRALSNYPVPGTTTFSNFDLTSFPVDQAVQGVLKADYIGRFSIYAHITPQTYDMVYDTGSGPDLNFNNAFSFSINLPSSKNYIYLRFRTWEVPATIEYLDFNRYGVKSSALPPVEPIDVPNDLKSKKVALYGNSITAINDKTDGTDYTEPIVADPNKWGTIVASYYEFSSLYSRGIGGQKYAWGNLGGSVAFIRPNGTLHSRNDSYNYDNVPSGSIPSGTVKVRGSFCSWSRITTMFPPALKNEVNMIIVKGATNDAVDPTDHEWVPNSVVDPEWAASSQYALFGGDYNISTLKGGIASTIMKLQIWMPQAIIVIATPLPGRGTTGQNSIILPTTETTKSIYVRDIARLLSIPIIDINANSGINSFNRATYITDAVHPYNAAGNRMLARTVIGGLKSIMPNI